ncbi:M24 family metallopeptidase [Halospeciosus flavus]|uniref:M24 family metallopeptidase n=1 Tax=Halospeciosus flavus TaxID=3032283 RepID=A0ABD5Z4X7_9EURY|nr:Xaa-Pro peptidase family protein [Halospeciosus flavus]
MTSFEARTRECQRQLADDEALVLFPSPNCYYLGGFDEEPGERHFFLFVPSSGDPAFVVPELYAEQVQTSTWVEDVRTWADDEDPLEVVREVAADLDVADAHLLLDATMWARFVLDLQRALPDATVGLADEVLTALRVRKDEHELDALREAADVADAVVEGVRDLGADAVGMTERELARDVESRLYEHGAETLAFDIIVGSGPNGAQPHHGAGDRTIESGDPVVLDFGARVDHYPSDQTRTVVFDGDPPAEFETVHETVREAQNAAVSIVEPGVEAQEVDAVARSVIEDAGYGEQFVHRTGHGVGLEVHESPYIVDGNDRELEPGMVFSVEPGIYLDGEFGVRIEDLVVVTEDGHERLNTTPRGWRV